MANSIERIFNLIKRTGDKGFIMSDDEVFAIMNLDDYEYLLSGSRDVGRLSGGEMLTKINRDIALWRESQKELEEIATPFDFPESRYSDFGGLAGEEQEDGFDSQDDFGDNDFFEHDPFAVNDEISDEEKITDDEKEKFKIASYQEFATPDDFKAPWEKDNYKEVAFDDEDEEDEETKEEEDIFGANDLEEKLPEIDFDEETFPEEKNNQADHFAAKPIGRGKKSFNNFGYPNPSDTDFINNASREEKPKTEYDYGEIPPPPDVSTNKF
jgi:hypothetical protein